MACISFFFHTIIIASLALCHTGALARNHTDDHLALLAIKSSITHDPQRVLDSWNSSFHFCRWQGVTCGHRHPRVTILDLGSRGIVGSLSPQLGNLSFLRVIRLENNTFQGVIPPQVGNLFRLQKLFLFNNSFEGEIPSSLFVLANNKLVGKIPQQLSSLLNLEIIFIDNNNFTGGIPYFFGNFTSLIILEAVNNNLRGSIPHALGQLHNLQEIAFGTNQLYGMIPPSLYNITSLEYFGLEDNHISGNLSRDIGLQLPNLKVFQIWGNKLTGNIPFSFSNCSNLEELGLSQNGFTGKVNINFSQMPNLWFLTLFENNIGTWGSDDMNFIDSLSNCTKLIDLLVQDNQLRGPLPTSVGNLSSQLSTLSFGKNFIYGPLPSGIGNLVKLSVLGVQFNHFTGIIPSELGNLQNIEQLNLDYNNFTGNFPDFVGNLTSLSELDLTANQLQGRIPSSLGSCTRLASLYFSVNNLTGPIPIELFQISSLLLALYLSYNHLAGPLPQAIGNLKSLMVLDLSHNHITGEIPNGIGSCSSLEYLYLKANSFQGPIPLGMSDLRGIREIDLSRNNFSGQIPRFLEQLNLSLLNLSFNNLDGEVPIRGIFKNASGISIDGNSRLCGGIPELGLPKCAMLARSKKHSHVVLVVVPLCSVLVSAMLVLLLFYWKRRKGKAPTIVAGGSHVQPFSRVSYGCIRKATNEFCAQNLIGSGTFSDVYKGILEPQGEMVAIKILKLGYQGALKSFLAECEALKNIRHRNLVKIITSCSSIDFQGNDFKALIYEFMPNGNLERWLHPSSEQDAEIEQAPPTRLSIRQRVTIATDVAHAIHYLHEDCEVPIIHCDLKPSNILLDNDMVAHIGDFGLAKFLPSKPHESSSLGIRGTIGYAAPEYGLGSEPTKEGDIYSFGILLLEILTGKRPTDRIFHEGMNLHSYVKMALPDRLMDIIEPTLLSFHENEMEAARIINRGRYEARKLEEGMVSLARIGLACSVESPKERMDTSSMVNELDRINEKLGFK